MIPTIAGLWFFGSLIIAVAGKNYRFGFWGYLFGSLLLSPVIGLLLLAAAVPKRTRQLEKIPRT